MKYQKTISKRIQLVQLGESVKAVQIFGSRDDSPLRAKGLFRVKKAKSMF